MELNLALNKDYIDLPHHVKRVSELECEVNLYMKSDCLNFVWLVTNSMYIPHHSLI